MVAQMLKPCKRFKWTLEWFCGQTTELNTAKIDALDPKHQIDIKWTTNYIDNKNTSRHAKLIITRVVSW